MVDEQSESQRLLAAIDRAGDWLDLPGVHLVGEGTRGGRPCIVVHASPPLDRLRGLVPEQFLGFPVVLVGSTDIRAGEK